MPRCSLSSIFATNELEEISTCAIFSQVRVEGNRRITRNIPFYNLDIIIAIHTTSHDRFLIIDDTEVYHIGASLKDLGKKLFAFSKLDIEPSAII